MKSLITIPLQEIKLNSVILFKDNLYYFTGYSFDSDRFEPNLEIFCINSKKRFSLCNHKRLCSCSHTSYRNPFLLHKCYLLENEEEITLAELGMSM